MSAGFSNYLVVSIQFVFRLVTYGFGFWIYRSYSVIFLAYLHQNYTRIAFTMDIDDDIVRNTHDAFNPKPVPPINSSECY